MKRFLTLSLLTLMSGPLGGSGLDRVRLPDEALVDIVGGVGAAITNVALPQDLITPTIYTGGVTWNKAGARCQFACSSTDPKPSSQGYNASAPQIAVLQGSATPAFEVLGDGRLKARVTASLSATVGGFDIYNASLATKCVGGATPGAVCNSTNVCGEDGNSVRGECRACDQTGNCADNSDPAPCAKVCAAGNNAGKPCTTANPDCPTASPNVYASCAVPAFGTFAETCYALGSCGSNGNGCTDCRQTGAGLESNSGGNNRNLHTVTARVLWYTTEIGRTDRVFQVVTGDANNPKTQCSSNCNGVADVSECIGPNCTFPPNCQ